ncbi:hypothetical protein [Natronolimnohabitans innermongolicus]|uniref:Uncharacterized protein n=1 Tax=Natronolimnohabitans innermongolicus JCM 12255 TaxID=1227499 RepID=L9X5J9_9EURY|nr:hypothetical protein [Natronolimnohabitans innermongolicus]ELY57054.1 hypothetical protein C493_09508 [Natronolimnohabitans innermongolicus JCM 12255]
MEYPAGKRLYDWRQITDFFSLALAAREDEPRRSRSAFALLTPSITGTIVVLVLEGEITVSVWVIVFTLLSLVIAAALVINYLPAFDGKNPPQPTDRTQATDEPDA